MASSRPLRRLFAALSVAAFVLWVSAQAVPAGAGPSPGRGRVLGERGSGMPAVPLPLTAAARAGDSIAWSDVTKGHWAKAAIDHVARTYTWMRDFRASDDGTVPFKPDKLETRRLFARALVRAFASAETTDPTITFPDLAETDRFFRFANIAVKLGWLATDPDGTFVPAGTVSTIDVHHALLAAVGMSELATAAEGIHLRNGTTFEVPDGFGETLIGMRAGFRYNHRDEVLDVLPTTALPRSEVAWSLYRAATMPTWVPSFLAPYADIELPNLGSRKVPIVQWAIDYVGYPYVWGGEWDTATGKAYCCGAQPIGGFDCSGAAWWVMRSSTQAWSNAPPRPYTGWPLPERTSAAMASVRPKLTWEEVGAGDLLFYDGDHDGRVDHVNVSIGNGWAIDSSSGQGGLTIMWVGSGWYFDNFVHARRIIPAKTQTQP